MKQQIVSFVTYFISECYNPENLFLPI